MTTPPIDYEKRHSKRIQRSFVVRTAIDRPAPRWSIVITHDISAGGAFFTIDQDVVEGANLLFKIHFIERQIECRGRVVRLIPGFQKPLLRIAVAFDWPNETERAFIEDFAQKYKA